MSLLTSVMDHSLDEGYAEAAAARGGDGPYRIPGTVRGLITLGAGLALVGAVITVGAVNAHKAEPTLAKERDALIHRINDANGSADHLQQQVQDLRRKVDSTQRQALAPGEGDPAALAGAVGLAEVTGPGVKLVLEDAAGTGAGGNVDPRAGQGFSNSGRLRDRDLQLVVNGLWARARRRSPSTGSGSPRSRRSARPARQSWWTTGRWCRRTPCRRWGTDRGCWPPSRVPWPVSTCGCCRRSTASSRPCRPRRV